MGAATFSAEQAAGLLGLTPQQLRAFARAGVVAPERGPGGELCFSFQDLVFLRDVARLAKDRVSPRRIDRAVRSLRARIDGPLSGVRLVTDGAHVVVREGDATWSPESGQYWLTFAPRDGAPSAPTTKVRADEDQPPLALRATAEGWYAFGCEIEAAQPDEARAAYARALQLDPGLAPAHVNWGCLEHEAGRYAEAEQHYRAALAVGEDATARFDLAVVLEDLGRRAEARAAYEQILAADPDCADAHFNLARLCDRLGEPGAALRHLAAYRRLTQR
jgi:tetratricopeptide (TPR) repeat protein